MKMLFALATVLLFAGCEIEPIGEPNQLDTIHCKVFYWAPPNGSSLYRDRVRVSSSVYSPAEYFFPEPSSDPGEDVTMGYEEGFILWEFEIAILKHDDLMTLEFDRCRVDTGASISYYGDCTIDNPDEYNRFQVWSN